MKRDWPEGLGELTNVRLYFEAMKNQEIDVSLFDITFQVGKQQHYELGQYFRKRYAKLLGNGDFLASNIYVRSTVVKMLNFCDLKVDQVFNDLILVRITIVA